MKLSVIVPVRNGGDDLGQCLAALADSLRLPDEVIVVDDASTDGSAALAGEFGAQVIPLPSGPAGPAKARNHGAAAAGGDVLVFIDADVAVHRDTLAQIDATLAAQPDIAALFGSYDDAPRKPGLISRYKNLQHHFVHQNARREAGTFWAGCGAIRRNVFLAAGGFDVAYGRPSIEDIELGVRLRQAGHRIWLCPEVQVAHLKRWTLRSWLRADIRDRAIPWTRLILTSDTLPADLGLDAKSRLSAVAAWGLAGSLGLGLWTPWAWLAVVMLTIVLVALNSGLYRLFARRGGLAFAAGAFPLHTAYYLYSSFIFGSLLLWHKMRFVSGALNSAQRVPPMVKDAQHDR